MTPVQKVLMLARIEGQVAVSLRLVLINVSDVLSVCFGTRSMDHAGMDGI